MFYRDTVLEVKLAAIRANIKKYQQILAPDANLMAVVKADGYGHGSIPILKESLSAGIKWAGVALVEEAIEIRDAGIKLPILLLGSWHPRALPVIHKYKITPVIYSLESADSIQQFAQDKNITLPAHLKIDTGMSRLGFSKTQLLYFIQHKQKFNNLLIEGIMSHLSTADEVDETLSNIQLERFEECYQLLAEHSTLRWVHISNSAAISKIRQPTCNLFRLGIGMYGQPPSVNTSNSLQLEEAITWKSSVVQLQWHEIGTPISYGASFITQVKTRVATICVGYGDGYSRGLSNNFYVLIHGQKAPVVGRVCMDMIMVDVTAISDVKIRDEVILIGKQQNEYISATQMAETLNTINYEIVCNISKRNPRKYI